MEAKARPRGWAFSPQRLWDAGYGARWQGQPSACAQVPQPQVPPFEATCLCNPCTAAGVGRTVGSGSLGSREGPERSLSCASPSRPEPVWGWGRDKVSSKTASSGSN